jgi:hypothetical protein
VNGEADGWGSKTKETAAAAFNNASPRKPNANAIFPAGPFKMFPPQDVFLSENCTIVLAQIGSTPILHCEVADIGEGTVSKHTTHSLCNASMYIYICQPSYIFADVTVYIPGKNYR